MTGLENSHFNLASFFKTNPSFKQIVSALKELLLEDNLLTQLPDDLDGLVNLKALTLMGNPMEEPPIEVCAKGKEAIFTYLKEKREMKVLAIKVKSAKLPDNVLIVGLERGSCYMYYGLYSWPALGTSIPCPQG